MAAESANAEPRCTKFPERTIPAPGSTKALGRSPLAERGGLQGVNEMACRKYYDGLCMGGNCELCMDNPKNEAKYAIRRGNMILGAFLISVGIFLAILMYGVLA